MYKRGTQSTINTQSVNMDTGEVRNVRTTTNTVSRKVFLKSDIALMIFQLVFCILCASALLSFSSGAYTSNLTFEAFLTNISTYNSPISLNSFKQFSNAIISPSGIGWLDSIINLFTIPYSILVWLTAGITELINFVVWLFSWI